MRKKLNQREAYVLAGGAMVIGLLLLVFAIIIPYGSAIDRLDNNINSRQRQLDEVRQSQAEYLLLNKQANQLKQKTGKGKTIPPLTFLEETASRVAGREHLVLMRPLPVVMQGELRIETIEFKLEKLDLEQVLRMLQAIEQAQPPMRVIRLQLKQRFDNTAQLDMHVTVSAPRSN